MNVEIGAEAAQFPEKEYINGIAVAVHPLKELCKERGCFQPVKVSLFQRTTDGI
jgi:hypothetical protein